MRMRVTIFSGSKIPNLTWQNATETVGGSGPKTGETNQQKTSSKKMLSKNKDTFTSQGSSTCWLKERSHLPLVGDGWVSHFFYAEHPIGPRWAFFKKNCNYFGLMLSWPIVEMNITTFSKIMAHHWNNLVFVSSLDIWHEKSWLLCTFKPFWC